MKAAYMLTESSKYTIKLQQFQNPAGSELSSTRQKPLDVELVQWKQSLEDRVEWRWKEEDRKGLGTWQPVGWRRVGVELSRKVGSACVAFTIRLMKKMVNPDVNTGQRYHFLRLVFIILSFCISFPRVLATKYKYYTSTPSKLCLWNLHPLYNLIRTD